MTGPARILSPALRAAKSPASTAAAIACAVLLAFAAPELAGRLGILGDIFVRALVFLSPFVMFFAAAAAFSGMDRGLSGKIGLVLGLFLISILGASLTALAVSFAHPIAPPAGIGAPPPPGIPATPEGLADAGFLWRSPYFLLFLAAAGAGVLSRFFFPRARTFLAAGASLMFRAVNAVILFAPIGIFGIVCGAMHRTAGEAFTLYGAILFNLALSVFCVFAACLPLLYWAILRRNPYPLLAQCLKGSAFCALLTRSSIANVPVNLKLARRLELDPALSAAAIPLGAVFHMPGAAVTLVTFAACALGAAGIGWSPALAGEVVFLSAFCALAAAGVPSGGLMMLPVLFGALGLDSGLAAQFMAVGFVTGVVQDAIGTALNSSSDVFLLALACGFKGHRGK